MFEKEAEEYVNEEYDFCYYPEDNLSTRINAERDWCKGAEFGYNKANEWHYPSKGEYPKECENVLCYCKVVGVKFCSIGHTIIGGDNKIRWWSNNRTEELRVIAWKEITPPKEIKENAKLKEQVENPKLAKAKEIIKDYMTIVKGDHTEVCGVPEEDRTIHVLKLNEEAEQFLKENT